MKFLTNAPLYLFALMAQSAFAVLGTDSIADGESNKNAVRRTQEINDPDQREIILRSCEGPLQKIRFRYNGGDCSQSDYLRTHRDFYCVDYNGGPGTVPGTLNYIVVLATNGDDYYFYNWVQNGDYFALNWDGEFAELGPDLTIRTYGGSTGDLLQETFLNLSCSKPLNKFDKFGSNMVEEWVEVSGRHVVW